LKFLFAQELAACNESMVKTQSSKHFLAWPKKSEGGKKGSRKVSAAACSLNKEFLAPFVGRTLVYKEMGHVDFLYNMLTMLSNHWKVPWLPFISSDDSAVKKMHRYIL